MKVKKMNQVKRSRVVTLGLILITALSSQAGNEYEMRKSVIASGNEIKAGGYVMNSVIGQPVITRSNSSSYQLTAGFFKKTEI